MGKTNFFNIQLMIWFSVACSCALAEENELVDFNRDIRPILSDNCYKCHGPDPHDRHADLRLDTKQGLDDATGILAAGEPDDSEFLMRVFSNDEADVMPPPESGRQLNNKQKELLKNWIAEGANWENHWSFEPAHKSPPPASDDSWVANEIDSFVLNRLNTAGIIPNDVADRRTLIRRVCLDLTGLPPSSDLLKRFVKTKSARWYEDLVELLFQSPQYGEHMARFWLDAARYADTHGLHLDNYREMWLYRDWVVDAFNQNLPYSDFLLEQLAGDLLESPTESQLIATGFNRAHVTTNEGGSITEEVLVRNVVDRVATTGTVFLGLTIGCAQCHDHKYDPITQKDFYSMYAFFNSLDANPMDGNAQAHAPILRYFDEEQKSEMASLRLQKSKTNSEIDKLLGGFKYVEPMKKDEFKSTESPASDYVWFDDELPKSERTVEWKSISNDAIQPKSGKKSFVIETSEFKQSVLEGINNPLRIASDDKLFFNVYLDPKTPPQQIMIQFNDGNWEHRAYWGENVITFGTDGTTSRLRKGDLPKAGEWVRLEVDAKEIGFNKKASIVGIAFSQQGGKAYWDAPGAVTAIPQSFDVRSFADWKKFQTQTGANGLPEPIKTGLTAKEKDKFVHEFKLLRYFLRNVNPDSKALIAESVAQLASVDKTLKDKTKAAPTTLIWREKKKPVQAHMLNRGEYDQKGDVVSRNTPVALPAFPGDLPRNRLGLAKWLLQPDNPLTARVAVNRFWQQFFGTGIVATSEDFGAQGELPSHPKLLDWLTIEFVESGWDVKSLVKKIVMSSTYRQSARADENKIQLDPENRMFSRGPRFRLDAETLRDQALAVSGLLVQSIGGSTVRPPQPDGLWYAVGYSRSNTVRFKKDDGHHKVHRRSLYTFWKRTAPPPQMSTLDAPSRESCLVRRERTNTPLQALLLMNESQYVEAARHLAQLALDQQHDSLKKDVKFIYDRAMGRDANETTLNILMDQLESNVVDFVKAKERAAQLVAIGETPADSKYDVVQLASLTMVANLIMNLDEFVSKN